ncbi:hypothetical protein PHYSODRAFT_326906 [Phytophthora sojae]|uniref:Prolyl 4-hydroxylase alpha subunit Fe(2+) 2OG dioxygenase domain-containing protein n=1 Tax=Phytophthora sojae (strain P6497) TaxID=1094619 RepID=G4YT25_PHYSP|nr:hypothetical protein PHYSODRAFT_326906 [Phytophthora sojae]EGZ25951.1 hypothetical protein PHYSODRAFT_326906 [Phytophthora sojae]|eukprot:XP_009521239.1 hypothetical protein PHYSODRAFT_326906 [Phytophthora sojae]
MSETLAIADENAGEYSFGGRAETLPPAPGILVNEIGNTPLPLDEPQAQKLIAKCKKSPFGHGMDTKMDENIRKSWQLAPDQVEIKNPLWQTGIDDLTEIIASRLGYKGGPLQCVLHKLLVYEEGGHFLKHQDTEKEDGMITTLWFSRPARTREIEHRHDFGRSTGSAPFFCHYVVHYADAEHALENVTKGFRLALVYSICLPVSMRHLHRDPNRTLGEDLVDVISSMGKEDESFALLLSHEYTKKNIGELGAGALKGVDSARFRALEEANQVVADDKKLRFFIAKLILKENNMLDEEGWRHCGRNQALHWYSINGKDVGHWDDYTLKVYLNFLNPGKESFIQLWKAYGTAEDVYTGNDGPIKSTSFHLENLLNLVSEEVAVEELLSRRPVDATVLRNFLDKLLLDVGDVDLAKLFLSTYCPYLGDDETPGESEMELLLQVADMVEDARAQQDLIKLATEKNLELRSSKVIDMFMKHILLPADAQTFEQITGKIMKKKPKKLGLFIEVFSKYVDSSDTTGKFDVLETIASERMDWLKEEISRLDQVDKTFSWKMPYAKDSIHPRIAAFLQGPKRSMTTEGVAKFADLHKAKEFVSYYSYRYRRKASFKMVAAQGNEPFVTITKTREWFDHAQKKLVQYREELAQPGEQFKGTPKKARHEYQSGNEREVRFGAQ